MEMIFLILLFIFICVSLTISILYVRGDLFFTNALPPPNLIKPVSAFPEYLGMKGPDVLLEIGSKYPQYSIEIVAPDYIKDINMAYNSNRVRLYVSRGGLVQNITIG